MTLDSYDLAEEEEEQQEEKVNQFLCFFLCVWIIEKVRENNKKK